MEAMWAVGSFCDKLMGSGQRDLCYVHALLFKLPLQNEK